MTTMDDPARRVAEAVLYEGYILWPYRRSALKNRRRWTFGSVLPEAYDGAEAAGDRSAVRAECLIEGAGDGAAVSVELRFLHTVRRTVLRYGRAVDELTIAGETFLTWDETTEREVTAEALRIGALADAPARAPVEFLAAERSERLDASAEIVRSHGALRGTVTIGARPVGDPADGVFALAVEVRNTTPGRYDDRQDALAAAFNSAHVVLRASGGAFVSLTDPPERLRGGARACRNEGLWPVLAGERGARHTVLAAPIILPDHPEVAPESPGDLFDATEIDQLLTLNILAMTDEERWEMRASDPRAAEILDRVEHMAPEELMRLHGTFREFGGGRPWTG